MCSSTVVGSKLLRNIQVVLLLSKVEVRKFLLDTMATLKTSDMLIDIQKLSESIRAGRKA
jgi:hypothetical protein